MINETQIDALRALASPHNYVFGAGPLKQALQAAIPVLEAMRAVEQNEWAVQPPIGDGADWVVLANGKQHSPLAVGADLLEAIRCAVIATTPPAEPEAELPAVEAVRL